RSWRRWSSRSPSVTASAPTWRSTTGAAPGCRRGSRTSAAPHRRVPRRGSAPPRCSDTCVRRSRWEPRHEPATDHFGVGERVVQTVPMPADPRQTIATLDLEGVLVPEIWIAVAERTGIDSLRRTTRDEPDYDVLMRYRLGLLAEHGLTMSLVADVIAGLEPLPGARTFLDTLRSRTQVVILSDTFEQFAAPLMVHLGMPTVFCHRLVVEDDR